MHIGAAVGVRVESKNGESKPAPSYSRVDKKRSHKEWRDLIRAELKGKSRNRRCTATCPICLISYDVDSLSNDASARALAVGKVASHINSAHADALTDCE